MKDLCTAQYDAHDALADSEALQRLVLHLDISRAMMLKHSFSVDFVIENDKYAILLSRNASSLKHLVDENILSKFTANKIAASGLHYDHLCIAHHRDPVNGIKSILSEKNMGKVRVTSNGKIIKSLHQYFMKGIYMAGTSGPEMPEGKADEDEAVTQFLMSIGLDCLTELFSRQKITMDILKEMTSENLKEAGVQEYGYRHKIIKELYKRKGTLASVQRSIYQRKRKAIFEQHNLIPSKKHCKLGKTIYQKTAPYPMRKSVKPRTQIPQIHQTAASTQTSFPSSQNNLSSTRNSNNHGLMQTVATQNISQTVSSNSLSNTNSIFPATSNSQIATRSTNQSMLVNIQPISAGNSQGTSQSIKLPNQSSVSPSATPCITTSSSSSTSTCSSCATKSSSACASHLTLTYDNDDAITEDEIGS
ncbi:uncharacterized protein LOC134264255 [Saccostrea cucullata]|uniref:uncharacterized protein LOC134264255 n=1 Tax=Saccostrea cuccullata TaxID=36930 RepID=UPI002ED53B7B